MYIINMCYKFSLGLTNAAETFQMPTLGGDHSVGSKDVENDLTNK